ncbi:MAG: hypothetical protein ABSD20_04790 [Terriglobales bacterium]
MSIRAVALRESIFEKRLEELNTPASNQIFYHSTLARCKWCRTPFLVLLRNNTDPRNQEYLDEIRKKLSEDCRAGDHSLAEIQLEMYP